MVIAQKEINVLPQLERQYLQANLAQVRSFLAEAELEDDPIGRHQYAQLVAEFQRQLDEIPAIIARSPATVALFFGGRPVVGSHGIQAEFSGKAVAGFQKILSQRFAAQEFGPLSARGRVPLKDSSQMLVTDVVRGSFGFVLQSALGESASESMDLAPETDLKAVVDQVAGSLSRIAAEDSSLFDDAVADIDDRQKGALTEFFKLLDDSGATLRIVEGERDFELTQAAISRARTRVENLQIREEIKEISGHVAGWTDYAGTFELIEHNTHHVLRGAVTRDALDRARAERMEPYHKHVRANIRVREVTTRAREPKLAYTLVSLAPIATPDGWVDASEQIRLSG